MGFTRTCNRSCIGVDESTPSWSYGGSSSKYLMSPSSSPPNSYVVSSSVPSGSVAVGNGAPT